jgi:hypothetical protein
MSKIDWIWPMLDSRPAEIEKERGTLESDIKLLEETRWDKDPQVALSEARSIMQREEDRRSATDGKASNYLLVIAALIPLLTYLESAVWDQKLGPTPKWISLIVLSVAVGYILGAAHWAFKTLTVVAYHTLDFNELIELWKKARHESHLVNEVLINTRKNSVSINEKVSGIKMTHIFLRRGIFCFGILIIIQAFGYIISEKATSILASISSSGRKPETTPPAARASSQQAIEPPVEPPPSCNPVERALKRATNEMNEAFAAKGFRGPVPYWAKLEATRNSETHVLGFAWKNLVQIYTALYDHECNGGRPSWGGHEIAPTAAPPVKATTTETICPAK